MLRLFSLSVTLLLFTSTEAQEVLPHALLVGDKAPVLPLDKWIKGGPLNIYDKKKVYLIDFWAVWCGPCIAGMEYLSELESKYKSKGLEVIGATSEDAWGNTYKRVTDFIKQKGAKFDYNFAWLPPSYNDNKQYKSIIYNPWIKLAYDSSSWALPQVFIIDRKGKIIFIGDGYTLTEDFIEKILNNNYDIANLRTSYLEKVLLENKVSDFLKLLDEKKVKEAETMRASIEKDAHVPAHALLVLCDNIFNKYADKQTSRLVNIAFDAAQKGVELTDSISPSYLAMLAKAYSVKGNPQKAVETLTKAINLSEGDFKKSLEKDLVVYDDQLKK